MMNKIMKKNKYLLIAGLFLTGLLAAQAVFAKTLDWPTLLKQTLPGADKFTQVADLAKYKNRKLTQAIFPAYEKDKQLGVIFYSAPPGYSGNLHTLVVLDMNGVVLKVNVFSHTETPAYVVPLDNGTYQRQFEGIKLTDKMTFLIGKKATVKGDIVAMTNATDTSKPIAFAVSEARKLFVELYQNDQNDQNDQNGQNND